MVRCADHLPAPGYIACLHVIAGLPVYFHELPSVDSAGQILCQSCYDSNVPWDETNTLALLRLLCAPCAETFCFGLITEQ